VELTENRLILPSIGVDLKIGEHESYLDFGGWVQETNDDEVPNLMAVHRLVWNTLSTEEKIKLTIYHIHKLEQGDVVYIVWKKQHYTYYVQEVVECVNNPEVRSDLIICTCKSTNLKQRVFVILNLYIPGASLFFLKLLSI